MSFESAASQRARQPWFDESGSPDFVYDLSVWAMGSVCSWTYHLEGDGLIPDRAGPATLAILAEPSIEQQDVAHALDFLFSAGSCIQITTQGDELILQREGWTIALSRAIEN